MSYTREFASGCAAVQRRYERAIWGYAFDSTEPEPGASAMKACGVGSSRQFGACLGLGRDVSRHAALWLSDACISCTHYEVVDLAVGLSSTMGEDSFKCYMADTGLLVAQLFVDNEQIHREVYRDILLGKFEINEGMFAENAAAQQLVAGCRQLLVYSQRDDAAYLLTHQALSHFSSARPGRASPVTSTRSTLSLGTVAIRARRAGSSRSVNQRLPRMPSWVPSLKLR